MSAEGSSRIAPRRALTRGCVRGGLTLVELLVSSAATAILLGAMASAVVLASRALPQNSGAPGGVVDAGDFAERVSSELLHAVYITERTASAVTFTVADRNGDGSPERIRYAWSGKPGDPVTRQYNNGAAVTILPSVYQFALGYDTKSVAEQYPGPPVESSEVEFSHHLGLTGLKDVSVDKNHWIGQYLQPRAGVLPVGVLSWRLTRVLVRAKRNDTTPNLTQVQIRTANADMTPTTTVLEEQTLDEGSLTDAWQSKEIAFSGVSGLSPGTGVCLVLKYDGAGTSAKIQYDDDSLDPGLLWTGSAGSPWTYYAAKSMQYYAYGKASIPGPTQSLTRQYVTDVRITLQVGADADARLDTAIRALNAPEALSAVWSLDFNTDPTTLDMNADGVGDWVRRDGQPFNPATLVSGVWQADSTLDTRPLNDFTQPITVDVRFRNTSVGGNGAVFWINADWSGGTFAPIFAYLQLQADGTQTLSVYHKLNDSTSVRLMSVPGLSSGFVDLRLLIDPGYNTVNVKVGGTDKGTYTFNAFTASNSDRFATVLPWGSNAEFDSVRVRVGGSH